MKYIPATGWLGAYRRDWLRSDLGAGMITAAVVIPKAMAYATIAGLPVEAGLYVAVAPMIAYALFGTARTLSVSSTTTIVVLVGAELAQVSSADAVGAVRIATALAFLSGAFLLLGGVLRLGFVANFISDPVLTGFKAGIGVVIVVDQIPKLLGLHVHAAGVLENLGAIAGHLSDIHLVTALLAGATLVVLFGIEEVAPRVPAPLAALAIGASAFVVFRLKDAGVVAVSAVPSGLPRLAVPDLSFAQQLWPGALGISLMAYIESIAAGRSFMRQHQPGPDQNQELVALGIANIAASLTGALPSGGGTSQTAVNFNSGARTQLAGLVTAGIAVAVLVALGPIIGLIPQATLAAIVVVTTIPLLAPREFSAIGRVRTTELVWALTACAGVILVGTLQGILFAVALSVLMLLRQANHPAVYTLGRKRGTDVFRPTSPDHPDDETFQGLLVARTEGRLTFASGPQMIDRLQTLVRDTTPRTVVLECSAIPDIEYTGLRLLMDFERKLREEGVALWLAALNPAAHEVVRRSGFAAVLGPERMCLSVSEAIQRLASVSSSG